MTKWFTHYGYTGGLGFETQRNKSTDKAVNIRTVIVLRDYLAATMYRYVTLYLQVVSV